MKPIMLMQLPFACLVCWAVLGNAQPAGAQVPDKKPELLSVVKIWDEGNHNAFTDLIRFKGAWYCSFREGLGHVGGDGQIRILTSDDGGTWVSAALIGEEGVDLRDPKLSVTPDGRLMVVAGGSYYDGKTLTGRQPRVMFSRDGREWTAPAKTAGEGDWLWRVTWHEGTAYGVAYRGPVANEDEWPVRLMSSGDGLEWRTVTEFEVDGRPNETTLRFLPSGRMVALVRREAGNKHPWIGHSDPPYTEWTWHETDYYGIGGPNFIVLPDGAMWAGGRYHPGGGARTAVARMTLDSYRPALMLPSGGDTSYPGFVWHGGLLWMSYYSSHEGKTSIYLARIRLPE